VAWSLYLACVETCHTHRCSKESMAVTDFVTVQHVPFPVARQRRTLEPDGIALFSLATAGDGSGGNVLITVRADDNEFFYILRTIALRNNGSVANPGPVVVVSDPEWIDDLSSFSQGYNIEIATAVIETASAQWRMTPEGSAAAIAALATHPMGKVRPLSSATQNLILFNWPTNTDASTYHSMGIFYVYRKEALTVPGFLNQLRTPAVGPGVVAP